MALIVFFRGINVGDTGFRPSVLAKEWSSTMRERGRRSTLVVRKLVARKVLRNSPEVPFEATIAFLTAVI